MPDASEYCVRSLNCVSQKRLLSQYICRVVPIACLISGMSELLGFSLPCKGWHDLLLRHFFAFSFSLETILVRELSRIKAKQQQRRQQQQQQKPEQISNMFIEGERGRVYAAALPEDSRLWSTITVLSLWINKQIIIIIIICREVGIYVVIFFNGTIWLR